MSNDIPQILDFETNTVTWNETQVNAGRSNDRTSLQEMIRKMILEYAREYDWLTVRMHQLASGIQEQAAHMARGIERGMVSDMPNRQAYADLATARDRREQVSETLTYLVFVWQKSQPQGEPTREELIQSRSFVARTVIEGKLVETKLNGFELLGSFEQITGQELSEDCIHSMSWLDKGQAFVVGDGEGNVTTVQRTK